MVMTNSCTSYVREICRMDSGFVPVYILRFGYFHAYAIKFIDDDTLLSTEWRLRCKTFPFMFLFYRFIPGRIVFRPFDIHARTKGFTFIKFNGKLKYLGYNKGA